MTTLSPDAIAQLFTEARTHHVWSTRQVDDAVLRQVYELTKWGPTSANTSPMRVVFVKSAAAKEKLKPALMPLNVEKTMTAPATAIIAVDTTFWEHLPKLFPGRDMKTSIGGMPAEMRDRMGLQSATLEAGYFILAARALGLDCGPMGGFDAAKVDAAFFADSTWRSTLLVNIGYGDASKLRPRLPRLDFAEAARIE
jgi:3-hydroxypropanoate dehydrogenase